MKQNPPSLLLPSRFADGRDILGLMFENTGVPLYRQLHDTLKQHITSGRWPEGFLLPAESQLMAQFGVGRETARRAVLQLVNEGFVYRQRGRGTYVCRRRPEDGLEQLVSFTSEMIARGYRPGTKLVSLASRPAGAEIAPHLACQAHDSITYIRRVRTANDLLVAVEDSYLRPDIVGEMETHRLESSFYEYLVYGKGLRPGRILQEIKSSLADNETAELLQIAPGHPILELSRLMFTVDGQPFFWMTFRFRGDVYSIKTKIELS